MYASDFSLMSDNFVRYLRYPRLVALFPQFTFERFSFDAGETVYVKGPGVPFMMNGSAEDCDDFTASGLLFCKMNEAGLVSEAVISNLLER